MSTARFDTLQNAAGSKSVPVSTVVDGSAKAWVNFNGTGTVAIRAAFNVSTITDNGVGDYTVNFTSALPDTNYGFSLSCQNISGSSTTIYQSSLSSPTTSALRFATVTTSGTPGDTPICCLSIFR